MSLTACSIMGRQKPRGAAKPDCSTRVARRVRRTGDTLRTRAYETYDVYVRNRLLPACICRLRRGSTGRCLLRTIERPPDFPISHGGAHTGFGVGGISIRVVFQHRHQKHQRLRGRTGRPNAGPLLFPGFLGRNCCHLRRVVGCQSADAWSGPDTRCRPRRA